MSITQLLGTSRWVKQGLFLLAYADTLCPLGATGLLNYFTLRGSFAAPGQTKKQC